MAHGQRLWLICYDIAQPRRLRQIARLMERHGTRVQKSVFECWLDRGQLEHLLAQARRIMDARVDVLHAYTLCDPCIELSEKAARTPIHRVERYYIV